MRLFLNSMLVPSYVAYLVACTSVQTWESGAQLGQTVHAEQSAISHAWMKGEEGLSDITINFSPCGHCRQFMNELTTAKELKVQLHSVMKCHCRNTCQTLSALLT